MKYLIGFSFLLGMFFSHSAKGQEKYDPHAMNYLLLSKPNNILYNDTIYKGSAQFKQLFFRQGNLNLMELYKKHQSNKITGQLLSLTGTIAMIIGIGKVTGDSGQDKGAGWALIIGGFATGITGGYLSLMGQRNLQLAVALFNQQNQKRILGMGVDKNRVGLVYNF